MKIVEIKWDGPYSLEIVSSFHKEADYGVYMVYGTHSIMGENSLLYIGECCDRCLGVRIPEHEEWLDWDYPEFKIYLGRFGSHSSISKEEWDLQIKQCEKLLISYCQPCFNTKDKNSYDRMIPDDILILNFGKRYKLPLAITSAWKNASHTLGTWKPFSNKMYP